MLSVAFRIRFVFPRCSKYIYIYMDIYYTYNIHIAYKTIVYLPWLLIQNNLQKYKENGTILINRSLSFASNFWLTFSAKTFWPLWETFDIGRIYITPVSPRKYNIMCSLPVVFVSCKVRKGLNIPKNYLHCTYHYTNVFLSPGMQFVSNTYFVYNTYVCLR